MTGNKRQKGCSEGLSFPQFCSHWLCQGEFGNPTASVKAPQVGVPKDATQVIQAPAVLREHLWCDCKKEKLRFKKVQGNGVGGQDGTHTLQILKLQYADNLRLNLKTE